MLIELTIRQFAIIKDLKVHFNQGLNILTGETGAGKSIIIDAIQLITGGRGSVEFIRSNSEKAEIEALFDLPPEHTVFQTLESLGIENTGDSMVLLKRELMKSGKSICRVNGQTVTLGMLKEVGENLIQLHSQHQHQQLLISDKQLFLLDSYGEKEILSKKTAFKELYQKYDTLRKETKKLADNEKEIAQRIDILQFQMKEISQAKLKPNEDEDLINKKEKIKHYEKITSGLKNSYQMFHDEKGIIDLLSNTLSYLEQITTYDEQYKSIYEQIQNAFYQIEDASMQLSEQVNSIEFDEEEINTIEERLAIIHHLKRKYGENVNEILEHAVTIEEELETLVNRDEHLQHLQEELLKVTTELSQLAMELSDARKRNAENLSNEIEDELKNLQMTNAKFKVEITYEEDEKGLQCKDGTYHVSANGIDKIEFLIAPNPGEPLKPINKTASGGELSRIMLAIQTILANNDDVPTLIFDEIDTGVSGRAAQSIAEKLAFVAKNKQVFAVTHLPQVASMADNHYLIQKNIKNNETYTEIEYLNEEKRIDEVARMLGGVEVTSLTKKHAKEMIEKTIPFKK